MKVAFILGDGYSGSTLLDLILGSHRRMTGIGEVDAEAFDTFLDEDLLCTCLFRASECHFWGNVLKHLSAGGQQQFRLRSSSEIEDETTQKTISLFNAVRDISSSEVLIDSSKRLRRVQLLAASNSVQPKIIHLIRDGRGVAYSYSKRGESYRQALLNWKSINLDIQSWLGSDGAPDSLSVKYEDLCRQPAEVIRRICNFLEVDWEPQMMRVGRKIHHNVRGNEMRFKSRNTLIKLDETWKDKLETDSLLLFEELTEPFSRQWGYL